MLQNKLQIESTFKSKETEEFLDVIFYRPLGYIMARISKMLGVTPNEVTIFSIFVGVIAGHLFYYDNLSINIIGIILLVWAEALDSADGQLARMINMKSLFGRILDGFGTNLWFLSIYINLCLRFINHGASPLIFLIAVLSGLSHSLQSAMADYYRNYYLLFVYGKNKSEVSRGYLLQEEYKNLSWSGEFSKKLLMWFYKNYTFEQEFISKKSVELLNYMIQEYEYVFTPELSDNYRKLNRKMIKYYNILTTNTRMVVLIISILTGYLPLYFIFEISVLNILLVYMVYKQERNSEKILNSLMITNSKEEYV